MYGTALHEGAALIPGGLLAAHPAPLIMPPRPGPDLIVEPWLEPDALTLIPAAAAGGGDGGGLAGGVGVERAGASPWVEVTAGLIGDVVSDAPARVRALGRVCQTLKLLVELSQHARAPAASAPC